MVRVQAAEKGTYGEGRAEYRFCRPGDIFDLKPGDQPKDWMVVVPDDTDPEKPREIRTEFDPKTRKRRHFLVGRGQVAAADAGPRSVGEIARNDAKNDARVMKARTAIDS